LLKLTDLNSSRFYLLSSFSSFGGESTSSITSILAIVILLFSWLPMIVEFYSDPSFSGKIRPVDLMV
jgi:hypothetical protein